MTKFMSRYEWEKLMESSYTIMPDWYYKKSECDKRYDEDRRMFNLYFKKTDADT